VLIFLGTCGVAILALASGGPRPLTDASDSLFTTGVILLALGAVAGRQLAARGTHTQARVRWLLSTYACAAALGIAGTLFGLVTGDRLRGIAYVAAGAIFSLAGARAEVTTSNRGSG
jgi:hypothetical protein